MFVNITFLVIFLHLIYKSENAQILAVFPVISLTRQFMFRPLLKELERRGHDIVLVTSYPELNQTPSNITEFNNEDKVLSDKGGNILNSDFDEELLQMATTFIEHIKSPPVSNILKEKTFDLLIADADVRSILVISHIYNIPVIQISTSGATSANFEIIGAPTNFIYPSNYQKANPTIFGALTVILGYNSKQSAYDSLEKVENKLLKKNFGPDISELSELYNSVHMLFVNVHSVWDENRPVPSTVLYLGGLHLDEVKPLPKDLNQFLDSSANGVIYVSFGSTIRISQLEEEIIRTMIKVLSELRYDVLIKADSDELVEVPRNIKTMSWIPQRDFLKHSKILLFITQGGIKSTHEAIDSLVPLISIPLIGDQWYNSRKIVEHKIGLSLEFDKITEGSFSNAINSVVGNDSYRQNLIKLRTIMRDQPQTPLERAVWWTEYVIRHSGARHLRAPAANMPWHQYLELELVFYFVVGINIVFVAFGSVVFFCMRKCTEKSKYKTF